VKCHGRPTARSRAGTAHIREQLPAQSDEGEDDEARDEASLASLAPLGHPGERMLEGERSERRG
jgi:hypothetical protein